MSDQTTNDEQAKYGLSQEERGELAKQEIRREFIQAKIRKDYVKADQPKRETLLGDLCEKAGLDRRFSYRRACDAGMKYMEAQIQSMIDGGVVGVVTPQPKREPMLSDKEIYAGSFTEVPWNSERGIGAANASKFYENLIASGELMTKAQAEKMAEDAVERYKDDYAQEHFWDE